MKLESIMPMKTDNEIDKAAERKQKIQFVMRGVIAVVCGVGLLLVVTGAQLRYGSCCSGFITTVGVFGVYTVLETLFVVAQNEYNKENGMSQINARNNVVLTLCRMAFMIAFFVLLPTTGACDGEKKEWTLIALISVASLFAIAEGLYMIYRSVWYCARLRVKRNAAVPTTA
jgi:hypothetical protein